MAASRTKQISNIKKQAEKINATFQKVKGSMSQSDISKAAQGIQKATAGVEAIRKSSGGGTKREAPVIKATDIGAETPNLPTSTVTTAPNPAINNVGLTGGTTGVTLADGNKLQVDPITEQYISTSKTALQKKLDDISGLALPSAAKVQKQVEKESGINQYRQQVSDYSSQINNIIAQRDAQALSLEGQGRGQTSGFIGGEQARINREAAIQALPVQALLANAQGNLDTAREYVNTWGKILMDDATNKYNSQVKSIEAVYDFATAEQKLRFDSLQAQVKEKKDRDIALASAKTQAISNALGQGAPASIVNAIKAATDEAGVVTALGKYNADLLAQEAQRANIAQSYESIASSRAARLAEEAKLKQIEDAIASGQVVLDGDQQKTAMSLGKQFEDESKNFKIQANAYNQILASADTPSAAGDLSLLFGYMKMLDPNSVVRETEFANAENAGGIPERIRAQYNKALSGERLTESMRADFVDRASKVYNSALDQQIDLENTYAQQGVGVYGLPQAAVDLIIRDIRAQGAVSDVAFGITLNNLSDEQLLDLRQSGLLTTPSGI